MPFQVSPVDPTAFFGREHELELLRDRVATGQSTIVVSELPNGRTSLLLRLFHEFRAAGRRVHFEDAEPVARTGDVAGLWSRIHHELGVEQNATWSSAHRSEPPPLLLIDEFHELLRLSSDERSELLSRLRRYNRQFVLVGASGYDIATMARQVSSFGSPVFNSVWQLLLRPFSCTEAETLLTNSTSFTAEERAFLIRCTGAHPTFLNRLASQYLFQCRRMADGDPVARRRQAVTECRFSDVGAPLEASWRRFSPDERWLLLRISAAGRARCAIPINEGSAETDGNHATNDSALFGALYELFQRHVPRDELLIMLEEHCGQRMVQGLPGAAAPPLTLFAETARRLMQWGEVESVIGFMKQRRAAPDAALAKVSGLIHAASPSPMFASPAERLAARGLLSAIAGEPGWEITLKFLDWWLLDQLQALSGASLERWLYDVINHETNVVSPQEGQRLRNWVRARWDLFRDGPTRAIEEIVL